MASKTKFTGSCHCGLARFTVELALTDPPVATRCNCRMCIKSGWTAIHVAPGDFTLLQPASEKELHEYQGRDENLHRLSCPKCAIQLYMHGFFLMEGKRHDLFTVSVQALDQPQEGLDLSTFKMKYFDGLNDNWLAGTRETPWPGGTI